MSRSIGQGMIRTSSKSTRRSGATRSCRISIVPWQNSSFPPKSYRRPWSQRIVRRRRTPRRRRSGVREKKAGTDRSHRRGGADSGLLRSLAAALDRAGHLLHQLLLAPPLPAVSFADREGDLSLIRRLRLRQEVVQQMHGIVEEVIIRL